MITSDQFFQHLRSALNHLYDPYFLKKSLLVKVFGLGDQPDAVAGLQRILNDGIAALEAQAEVSPQRRRSYELIMYRYVQQFGQEEVANQLGMSVRHLRREQNAAIYDLAAILWEQYSLGARPFQVNNLDSEDYLSDQTEMTGIQTELLSDHQPGMAAIDGDLAKMKEEIPLSSPTSFYEVLEAVLDLLRPLASRYNVNIQVNKKLTIVGLAVQQVALRQLLLNILTVMVHLYPGSQVQVTAKEQKERVLVYFAGEALQRQTRQLSDDERSNLEIAGRILDLYGGKLEISERLAPNIVMFDLPAFRQRKVLVIDDNLDFIQLVERSLTGTRFKVTGERIPQQAVSAAEVCSPDLILLDVMMPNMDGWEVLGRLRSHPKTMQIPIIVCTVLPQEELALSLGASGYLRKPVTQESVLDELDQQMAFLEQGSR